ncbi:hypothetical protein KQX54_020977 [Cotesia glomerata]|uniref:Uncharacterized protein n=1 Tax=Cotesia glomerata TaxID=32391 RepID=A0AAV7I1S1_COTGL|nr:hypothetical protein KQX54_020977 [Cotesia glomerata]
MFGLESRGIESIRWNGWSWTNIEQPTTNRHRRGRVYLYSTDSFPVNRARIGNVRIGLVNLVSSRIPTPILTAGGRLSASSSDRGSTRYHPAHRVFPSASRPINCVPVKIYRAVNLKRYSRCFCPRNCPVPITNCPAIAPTPIPKPMDPYCSIDNPGSNHQTHYYCTTRLFQIPDQSSESD